MKEKDEYSHDTERKQHCLDRGIKHLATASNKLSNIFLANGDLFSEDFHEVTEGLDAALLCFAHLKGMRISNCSSTEGVDNHID